MWETVTFGFSLVGITVGSIGGSCILCRSLKNDGEENDYTEKVSGENACDEGVSKARIATLLAICKIKQRKFRLEELPQSINSKFPSIEVSLDSVGVPPA
jgi:hypothetical protein